MEFLNLRAEDVVILRERGAVEATLRLGVAERGESAKTGMRQGVRVDSPHVVAMLARRIATLAPGERLFQLSKPAFVKAWVDAGAKLGIDLGPPH
eukprot:16432257-Heterocapsa_arctica.AAC.1